LFQQLAITAIENLRRLQKFSTLGHEGFDIDISKPLDFVLLVICFFIFGCGSAAPGLSRKFY